MARKQESLHKTITLRLRLGIGLLIRVKATWCSNVCQSPAKYLATYTCWYFYWYCPSVLKGQFRNRLSCFKQFRFFLGILILRFWSHCDLSFSGPLWLGVCGTFVTCIVFSGAFVTWCFRSLCKFRVFRSFVTWGFWSYCDLAFSERLSDFGVFGAYCDLAFIGAIRDFGVFGAFVRLWRFSGLVVTWRLSEPLWLWRLRSILWLGVFRSPSWLGVFRAFVTLAFAELFWLGVFRSLWA